MSRHPAMRRLMVMRVSHERIRCRMNSPLAHDVVEVVVLHAAVLARQSRRVNRNVKICSVL